MVRTLHFDRAWRDEAFRKLIADYNDAVESRSVWWDDYNTSHANYRMIPPEAKRWPWPNCSNLVPPLVFTNVEQSVRRQVMTFVQSREYVTLTDLKPSAERLGVAKKNEELLRWQGDYELDYLSLVDHFIREYTVGGSGFIFNDWCHEETIIADATVLGRERLVTQKPGQPPVYRMNGEPKNRKTSVRAIADELMNAQGYEIEGLRPDRRSKDKSVEIYRFTFKDKGRRRVGRLTIDRNEERGDELLVVAELPKVVKNQPVSFALTADRVVMPPGDHTVHTAPFVAVKTFCSFEFCQEQWKAGTWHSDDDEKERLSGKFLDEKGFERRDIDKSQMTYRDESEAQDDQDDFVGVDSNKFLRRKMKVLTFYTRYPILQNRSEKMTVEAAITVLPDYKMVVRVQHKSIDSPVGDRKRPIVTHKFLPIRNEAYGVGLPRILQQTHEEYVTVRNMQIDALNITTNPVLFIDPSVTFSRDNASYHPGAAIRVFRPGENVLIPQWPSRLGEFEAQLGRLAVEAQDVTAQGPTSVGRDPGGSGAGRTARGQAMLLSERNFNVFYDARLAGVAIEDYWEQVHGLNAARMPPEKTIALFGTDETASSVTINRKEVRGAFQFRFEAGQATLNDEMRRMLFTEAFQLTSAIAQADPVQVPRPLWEMASEVWKQRGIKDPRRFLPTPTDFMGDPLDPETEHQFFEMGRSVPVHPLDVDQLHLEAHVRRAMMPSFQKWSKPMVEAFGQHILMHQKRIAAATAQSQGAGQSSIGPSGVVLGGRLALQGNPGAPAAPGAPPPTQPDQVTGVGG